MAVFELIPADGLERILDDEHTVVIDTRSADAYWQSHVPGARHLAPALLALQRTDAGSLDRFHTVLEWALSALGISSSSRVVVVGGQNDAPTAKAAWALAYAGLTRVALLDGGLSAWPGAQTAKTTRWAPSRFKLAPQSRYLATAEDVLSAVRNGDLILDARSRDEFDGLRSNAGRKGRVPGALFWDSRQELNAEGRYATPLAEPAERLEAGRSDTAIVYCAGGGRAARTFIALQLSGRPAAVYPASWQEWGVDERYPVQAA